MLIYNCSKYLTMVKLAQVAYKLANWQTGKAVE